jgi:hypothetical protein
MRLILLSKLLAVTGFAKGAGHIAHQMSSCGQCWASNPGEKDKGDMLYSIVSICDGFAERV